MRTPTEVELVDYMIRLHQAEADGQRQEVVFGPFTAILVIGAIQLATRHPGMPEHQRVQLRAVVDQFRPWFAGTPGEHIIYRGDNPEYVQ